MRRYGVAALALIVAGCAKQTASDTTVPRGAPTPAGLVFVVRHAEKAPEPVNDPVLSAKGIARAASLDSTLAAFTVSDVVVSQLQRTRLTAANVITRSHAVVHVIPIGPGGVTPHIAAVADTVRKLSHAGRGVVLVVGHSNTVTQIVEALGGGSAPALCDSQYSQLFALRDRADRTVELRRQRYGAPDPSDATCAATAPGMMRTP